MNDTYIIASPRPGRYLKSSGSTKPGSEWSTVGSARAADKWNDADKAASALRSYVRRCQQVGKDQLVTEPQLFLANVSYTNIAI